MTTERFIKQAYAYGASLALQELGFSAVDAQNAGVKLAEDRMMEKTALSGPEIQAAIQKLLAQAQSGAGQVGSAIGGAAQQAGSAIGGAGRAVGEGAMGAGRAVGEGAMGAGRAVGNEAQALLAALQGGGGGAKYSPRQMARSSREALGLGAGAGLGLGAGGMALAD